MSDFYSDIRIQQSLLILLLSAMIAFLIFGFLLVKFRFLDSKQQDDSKRSPSKTIGTILIFLGSVFSLISLLLLVASMLEG